jgi:hypothetical protein
VALTLDTLAPMSERIATELLKGAYEGLTGAQGGVEDCLQALQRITAALEGNRAADAERLSHLVSAVSELDVPAELVEALRAFVEGRRESFDNLVETLEVPVRMLEGTIGYIETRQKMIREQGFA